MRAAVYRSAHKLHTETVPVPPIGKNELLVRVATCGVCPTDIKKIHYGTVPPPRIFGHETAGTIVKMGSGVPRLGFGVGERVALHHHVPCLDCHFCRHRAFAQCETYKRTGITAGFEPAGGGYAEYVRVMPFVLPGVVKIPARNTFAEGAMLEPVNTVLKAVNRLNLLPGDNVLVAGQGPIGLMFTKILQLRGVNVLATDLMEQRLKLAKKFGARWTRLVERRQPNPQSIRAVEGRKSKVEICSLSANEVGGEGRGEVAHSVPALNPQPSTLNRPFDAAVLAVPSDAAVAEAFDLVRGGGQIMLFAHTRRATAVEKAVEGRESRVEKAVEGRESSVESCSLSANEVGGEGRGEVAHPVPALNPQPSTLNLDFASICVDEKDLIGSYSADFTLQKDVARLVFSRQLDVRQLISHEFPLDQTAAAVALAAHPHPDSLKVIVNIP